MNKEEIKELVRENMLETIKTNLDSTMIFTYVKSLEDRIDKAIEILQDYDLVENKDKVISDTFKALRGEDNEDR